MPRLSYCWNGLSCSWSYMLDHHVTAKLNSPADSMLAVPTTPSFTSIQRERVTLWVHASRKEPVSSSRAMSGAPQNTR